MRKALFALLLSSALTGAVATLGAQGLQDDALEIAERDLEPAPPQSEGALQNDAFLPNATEAGVLLARGDSSLTRSRTLRARGSNTEADRALTAAFDDWFTAVQTGAADASVFPDPASPGPLTEGLGYATLRRLDGLDDAEKLAWRKRVEAPAAISFEAARKSRQGNARLLSGVERSFPGTMSACRAALARADRALERGHDERVGGWLERANRHTLGLENPPLRNAIEARRALLGPEPRALDQAWDETQKIEPAGFLELIDHEQEEPGKDGALPQRGVRPGLAWFSDDEVIVQSASIVHQVRLDANGPRLERSFSPLDLVALELGAWESPYAGREAPGWGLAPAVSGNLLVLTGGRAFVGFAEDEAEPNTLMAIRVTPSGPRLEWAVSGSFRIRGSEERQADERLVSTGTIEFQAAPIIHGSLVLVAAREIAAEQRVWLYAFELETGELAWRRFIVQGEDIARGGGRFGSGPGPRLAEPAPLVLGERVFVGTHLGACGLFDVVDGRPLWTMATRRRGTQDKGWTACGPLSFSVQSSAGIGVLWDPADSDVLYRLRGEPLGTPATRASLLLAPPQRIGRAELLLGGGEREAIVFGQAASSQAISLWPGPDADPIDALHLGPRERFRGRGFLGRKRVLASTERGLLLFDRERELYLTDYAPLTPFEGASGGDVHARGSRICVLEGRRLSTFRCP